MTTLTYYKDAIRHYRRMRLLARAKLFLFSPAAMCGIRSARGAADHQRDIIAECEYALEEFIINLERLQTRGTTWSFVLRDFNFLSGDSGYDGWLTPEDQYQG